MHPDKPAVGFENDARDGSSSQEWDDGHALDDNRSLSSQKSDAGYYSSSAMSDSAAHAAATSSFDHGHNPMSSMRSVGSTGSQGSSRGLGHATVASHLVNGETRFPTATSYASDAQRSDVATVCSGSVVEDIEVESVVSADLNVQSSPPSSVKMAVGTGGSASSTAARSASGQLAGADQRHDTVVPPGGLPVQAVQGQPDPALALHNDMGPPLSRSLLLQHPQHHHQTEGNSSQAGSVRSFESNTGSDVIAHVDTDDCGGSLDMDVHSIHSQEDAAHTEGNDPTVASRPINAEGDGEEGKKQVVNPLLCSDESNANGRTSPGGTIYKGRGNRRYQGRYMHLPLKRFHQNGVDLGDEHAALNHAGGLDNVSARPYDSQSSSVRRNGVWGAARGRDRSPEYQYPRDRGLRDRRMVNGSRARSRSRSRSRSRDRGRDHTPQHINGSYDHRKPRARRWQHNGESSSLRNANNHRSQSRSRERSGYNSGKGDGGPGNNRSPNRNRNRKKTPS